MSPPATYDTIGRLYARFRRPDPRIAAALNRALGRAATVLHVGAGTGSYEPPGRSTVAVEPSAVMISQRRADAAPAVMASADALPFPDNTFDAAMAVLTVHHWPDLATGLAEMRRVARRQVVFAFDPTVHNDFWLLREYIPAAAQLATNGVSLQRIVDAMGATKVEIVPVPSDCTDGFGWAYWRRPAKYLNPDARACISMLALLDRDALRPGLARLEADLDSGEWFRRHRDLLDQDSIDGGFRLLVAGPGL